MGVFVEVLDGEIVFVVDGAEVDFREGRKDRDSDDS